MANKNVQLKDTAGNLLFPEIKSRSPSTKMSSYTTITSLSGFITAPGDGYLALRISGAGSLTPVYVYHPSITSGSSGSELAAALMYAQSIYAPDTNTVNSIVPVPSGAKIKVGFPSGVTIVSCKFIPVGGNS